MKNYVARFKSLPVSTRRLLSIGVLLAFVAALPLFVYAILNNKFLLIKKAASGEEVCAVSATDFSVNLITTSPSPTSNIDYQMIVKNNDTGPCVPIQYTLSATLPNGWTSIIPNTTFTVGPGNTYDGAHVFLKNQALTSYPQTFTFNLTSGVTDHAGTVTVLYPPAPAAGTECGLCGGIAGVICNSGLSCTPRANFPDQSGICTKPDGSSNCVTAACTHAAPSVVLTPTVQSGDPGTRKDYTVTVTNLDTLSCNGTAFSLQAGNVPSGWVSHISDASVQTVPTHIGTSILSITPPTNPAPSPGPYDVSVTASGNNTSSSGHATYNILPSNPIRYFAINFKFDGINDDSASFQKQASAAAKVTVKFLSASLGYPQGYVTSPIMVDYAENGIYVLHFGVSAADLPPANDYAITLKGEKTIATKFCTANGQVAHCSGAGNITIPVGTADPINLNFTGLPLQAGDVFPQDGAVNSDDFNKVVGLLAKPCSLLTDQERLIGDLDYNGCVTVKDVFLIRQTLQARYDEN